MEAKKYETGKCLFDYSPFRPTHLVQLPPSVRCIDEPNYEPKEHPSDEEVLEAVVIYEDVLPVIQQSLTYFGGPYMALSWAEMVWNFGAAKYGKHNWKQGSADFIDKYLLAIRRHITEQHDIGLLDKESGYPHQAHMLCDALIITWLRIKHGFFTQKELRLTPLVDMT